MADETKKNQDLQNEKSEFEDPELLDMEDLDDVAGGGICITGGGCDSREEIQ